MADGNGTLPPEARESSIDPVQQEHVRRRLISQQNLPLGAGAGLVASLVGAAAWAAVTVTTGYQLGIVAIGIGFLVGYAIRVAGRGLRPVFGVVGAALALLGCALGNLVAVTAIVADGEGIALFDAISRLDPAMAGELMAAFFTPMDLVFYAIAAYEGYQLSFRRLTSEELVRHAGGPAA